MEKISSTDRMRKEEVLQRAKQEKNIVHIVQGKKDNQIGHIWFKDCVLKHVTEGKIEKVVDGTGKRGRRRKQLLDELKERRGYCKLKEEALDRTVWRTG